MDEKLGLCGCGKRPDFRIGNTWTHTIAVVCRCGRKVYGRDFDGARAAWNKKRTEPAKQRRRGKA